MKTLKKFLNEIFIDGLSGMALGLFSTLIIGTIIAQIGTLVGGSIGAYMVIIANVAKTLTGAGIGVGVAVKLKQGPLVTVSAAIAGLIGAFPAVGTGMTELVLGKPGEPLGAFVAAIVAIELGKLVAGKTPVDIIVTPFVCIIVGAAAGLVVGPPISKFMLWLGGIVNFNVEAHPIIGGIIVSVLMGMILTLPISSAAIGISMGITGLAAGAATIGCCCNMVGFAVASYRENKMGGLIAQGVGTSMLQVPNIVKKPVIWVPAIVSSAVLGPISSAVLKMTSNPVGSGMGSAGFVGQIATFQTMAPEIGATKTLVEIVVMQFILPAVVTLLVSEFMRKKNIIKSGDMALNLN
ncbi:MAG: PTS sugar transporter subunit IIC [Oscillospiraceae bacterium]|nr:PTS sugar transporter subunit IIC [Oscillospiraceae bacterium]